MATYEHILVDHQDGIITLTFNHPENLNAMTAAMVGISSCRRERKRL